MDTCHLVGDVSVILTELAVTHAFSVLIYNVDVRLEIRLLCNNREDVLLPVPIMDHGRGL
jgi:hypothetical protein